MALFAWGGRAESLVIDVAQFVGSSPSCEPQASTSAMYLHPYMGVVQQTAALPANSIASLGGSLYPAAGLKTLGTPTRFSLSTGANSVTSGGTVQAMFAGGIPAIISKTLGTGHALTFAFDLATLMAQPNAANDSLLADTVVRSLAYLATPNAVINSTTTATTPAGIAPGNSPVPGAPQTLSTALANTGSQVASLNVQALLPAGVNLLASQPSVASAADISPQANGSTLVNWAISLQPGQTSNLILQVSSGQAGSYSVPVQVQASAPGATAVSQTVTHSFTLSSVATLIGNASAALVALKPTGSADTTALSNASYQADLGKQFTTQGRYAEGLVEYLVAANYLRGIASANTDTSQALQALAWAEQAAARQLCQQRACLATSVDVSVNSQSTRQVQLGSSLVGSRNLTNNCTLAANGIGSFTALPVTTNWVNRRTGSTVLTATETFTLTSGQSSQRTSNWVAAGQVGDTIDISVTAAYNLGLSWAYTDTQLLARDQFQLLVGPTKLSATLSASPTHAKAGVTVALNRSVGNTGASATAIPLKLHITNTSTGGTLVQDINQSADIATGQTSTASASWVVQGAAGNKLKIELIATVAGSAQTLATTTFTVDK